MSDLSLYQHWSTLSAIDRAGDRMHAGLMSLATAQAGAMEKLGKSLGNQLLEINESILTQDRRFSELSGALNGLRDDMRQGFVRISDQISGLDAKLDKIEQNTSNPEETRAWERYRRAADLLKKGHAQDALEHLEAAIANDGGPAFRHVPAFHLMLGQIRIGDTVSREASLVDYDAAHCAFRQASLHLDGEQKAVAICRAGAAAFLDDDYETAAENYLEALQIPHQVKYTHFELAKCFLLMGQNVGMSHHLRHAIDRDWTMTALVATDLVFLSRADDVKMVVQTYRDEVFKALGSGPKAMELVLTGAVQQAVDDIWSAFNEQAGKAVLNDLHPWVEVGHEPKFVPNQAKDTLPRGTAEKARSLASGEMGLLDISVWLKSIQVEERTESKPNAYGTVFVNITSHEGNGNLISLTEHFEKCRSMLGQVEAKRKDHRCFFRFRSGLRPGHEIQTLSSELGGRKPGMIGRLVGKKEIPTRDELQQALGLEEERLREEVARLILPVTGNICKPMTDTSKIVGKAEQALKLIQTFLSGEDRFLGQSPSTLPDASEDGLALDDAISPA